MGEELEQGLPFENDGVVVEDVGVVAPAEAPVVAEASAQTEDDKDEVESGRAKYYVVRGGIEGPFSTKKEAARYIEDSIESGRDPEKFSVLRGKPCELAYEVKTKVVIK